MRFLVWPKNKKLNIQTSIVKVPQFSFSGLKGADPVLRVKWHQPEKWPVLEKIAEDAI
jgi:hypothetical protein